MHFVNIFENNNQTERNDKNWEGKDYTLIALASNDELDMGVPGKKNRNAQEIKQWNRIER